MNILRKVKEEFCLGFAFYLWIMAVIIVIVAFTYGLKSLGSVLTETTAIESAGVEEWARVTIESRYGVRYPNSAIIAKVIVLAGEEFGQDPLLIMAIINQESHYKSRTNPRSKAEGFMQVKKKWWKETCHKYDISSKYENIFAGTCAMDDYFKKTGNIPDMLVAYNIGITNFEADVNLLDGFRYRDEVLREYRKLIDLSKISVDTE